MTSTINELMQEQAYNQDKKYTLKVKETYLYYITGELKEKFDTFTDNMMNDDIINDYSLWCIACKFKKQHTDLCKSDKFSTKWEQFTDVVFNFRPWQT